MNTKEKSFTAANKAWYANGGKEKKRQYAQNSKIKCLEAYSNGSIRCACCGEDTIEFLSLDHKNNDGHKDRKKYGSGSNLYTKLRVRGFPDKERIQVLCFNCNMGKATNGGICPHKR